MKMIFPKADETLLLDILANTENNVQKASEKVMSLGYVKKEFIPQQKATHRPHVDHGSQQGNNNSDEVNITPVRPKEYTEEEKLSSKYYNLKALCILEELLLVLGI